MSITLAGTDLWASAGVDCDTQIRRRETGLGAVSGSLAKQPASLWLATIAFPSTSLQDGSSQRAVEAVERSAVKAAPDCIRKGALTECSL